MIALVGLMATLGAAIGSFLNVVIHRVPTGLSVVNPPSACPNCSARIRWYDNVPIVSWLVLRGRCRQCGTAIPVRYLLVEVATSLAFGLVAAVASSQLRDTADLRELVAALLVLVAFLFFASIGIALTAIDVDTHRLPNAVVLPAYPVTISLLGAAAWLGSDLETAARAAAGGGILFAFYLALALLSPRGMGMGDVKLAGVVGLYLGWIGWPALAVGAFAAFMLGGTLGLALLIMGRAQRGNGIPFGPWMLAGAWIGIAWGEPIARGYLTVFGLN